MQATATSDLSTVFLALRHELADWASASERLESVLGDILEGHALNANEMEGVQALDSLSQHLRQLAQLCGDLGAEPLPVDHETGDRVRKAVARLNLGGLGQRIGRRSPVAVVEAGEAELW
jgi:hypothetical protein